MNVSYNRAVELLKEAGIESPEYDASLLFEKYCGAGMAQLLADRTKEYRCPGLYEALCRRASREPLQYILGSWYFYGLEFELNHDCLCPREDTEITAETAIKLIPRGARFADIGTGSGCIAVSVLVNRPDLSAVCTDISGNALSAARENAERHGVADRAEFAVSDALAPGMPGLCGDIDAVVSNPPYIPAGEIDGLGPEVLREPRRALDGGTDGLDFYRSITRESALRRVPLIIYEAGAGEAGEIIRDGARYGYTAEIYRDLSGIDRTVVLTSGR